MTGAAMAARLITLFDAKQYLGGGTPEALGVERVPGMRRRLYDRSAIDLALDWLKRKLAVGQCPHCGRELAAHPVSQGSALDTRTDAAHLKGVNGSPLGRSDLGKAWLKGHG